MRGQHPNSRKNLARPKLPETHSTATVRVSGPREAVERFSKGETAESRGKLVAAVYSVPVDRFPPITIKQTKPPKQQQ